MSDDNDEEPPGMSGGAILWLIVGLIASALILLTLFASFLSQVAGG